MVEWMAGRRLTQHVRSASLGEEPVLEVENVTVPNPDLPDRPWVKEVSFVVKQGEVLGLAGLAGSGASELLAGIFGRVPRARGRIKVLDQTLPLGRPSGIAPRRCGLPHQRSQSRWLDATKVRH